MEIPENFKPKTFWERPEGTTGMIVGVALLIAAAADARRQAIAVQPEAKGLVPGSLPPFRKVKCLGALPWRLRRFANHRRGNPVLVIDKIVAEAPFHTQVTLVDNAVKRRCHSVNVIILHMQFEVAAHPAIRAGGGDNPIGFYHNYL